MQTSLSIWSGFLLLQRAYFHGFNKVVNGSKQAFPVSNRVNKIVDTSGNSTGFS